MKLIKTITAILFLVAVILIVSGLVLDAAYNQKLIGFGVVTLFLLVFPLFSYYRWKGKDIKDYMLTKENLEKMRESQKESKY
jgi:membrane protein YdbS with pleckstrin-like domain